MIFIYPLVVISILIVIPGVIVMMNGIVSAVVAATGMNSATYIQYQEGGSRQKQGEVRFMKVHAVLARECSNSETGDWSIRMEDNRARRAQGGGAGFDKALTRGRNG